MNRLFRDSFVIQTALPVDRLVLLLRPEVTPPPNWMERFRWSFNHPFTGAVTEQGLSLRAHYNRMPPRIKRTFVPGEHGTRVSVEVSTIGPADWILYGVLLAFVSLPMWLLLAYPAWLLACGQGAWVVTPIGRGFLCLLPPLALVGVVVGSIALGSRMSRNWTRKRLVEWLTAIPARGSRFACVPVAAANS